MDLNFDHKMELDEKKFLGYNNRTISQVYVFGSFICFIKPNSES
jgi:hypothetical protein